MFDLGAYPASSKPRPGQGPSKPEDLGDEGEGAYKDDTWDKKCSIVFVKMHVFFIHKCPRGFMCSD